MASSPFRNSIGRFLPSGPMVAITIASSIAVIAVSYTHYAPTRDKREMRAGVERDKERLRLRRIQLAKEKGHE